MGIVVEGLTFKKISSEEWLEEQEFSWHAVDMVAGSDTYSNPPVTKATCSGGWDNKSLDDMPDGRGYHTAVWTGTEMIVWGGATAHTSISKAAGDTTRPRTHGS